MFDIDIDALRIVRNMAYEFQDQGRILYDLVETDDDPIANQEALDKQEAAIDLIDAFLIEATKADTTAPYHMANVFYSDGSGNARPKDPSIEPGWYYQLDMREPRGPYDTKADAEAALRTAANEADEDDHHIERDGNTAPFAPERD